MMENEAAYKKFNQERENVHRLMRTTFEPNILKQKRDAERLLQSQDMKRYTSLEGVIRNSWEGEK